MTKSARDVLITGIGIVSSLGDGAQSHLSLIDGSAKPVVDQQLLSPHPVHPLPEIDWSLQIPKRGDQRQMETWQRLGTYAAGRALDDAGLKDNDAACDQMDLVVAAGGGERDETVDGLILADSANGDLNEVALNERLTTELRPTLFLAQLSNLLAGNISIVHKVTGSSRTFMGEEMAGASVLHDACARIRSGQSEQVLIGGAYQAEHPDMLNTYALDGILSSGNWLPFADRSNAGVIPGSGAAFLVLETRQSAEASGRKAYAKLGDIVSGRSPRNGSYAQAITRLLQTLSPATPEAVVSAACGAAHILEPEVQALTDLQWPEPVLMSETVGHLKEAQLLFGVALSALLVANNNARSAVATTVGTARGEAAALITEA